MQSVKNFSGKADQEYAILSSSELVYQYNFFFKCWRNDPMSPKFNVLVFILSHLCFLKFLNAVVNLQEIAVISTQNKDSL